MSSSSAATAASFPATPTLHDDSRTPSPPHSFTLMQWNLLATGLHDDGFVQSNLFSAAEGAEDGEGAEEAAPAGGPSKLTAFLEKTRSYQHRMLAKYDADAMKGLQDMLNRLLFSDEIVGGAEQLEELVRNLGTGVWEVDPAAQELLRIPEERFYGENFEGPVGRVAVGRGR